MKPIQEKTILSIIHGPATETHIAELSLFLRREINVWFKNENQVWLFGRDFHRQPRISLEFTRAKSSDGGGAGHFALVDGNEPRTLDNHHHQRHNCAFDVISDQTGYPAVDLRDIAARRILINIYQARLRGKDYEFKDDISGGATISISSIHDAEAFLDRSASHGGHARSHVEKENCGCNSLGRSNCVKCYSSSGSKTGFKSEQDQNEILWKQMQRDGGAGVQTALTYHHTYPVRENIYSLGLRKVGVVYEMQRKQADDYYIGVVNTVFRDSSDPFVLTMYPLYSDIYAMSRSNRGWGS